MPFCGNEARLGVGGAHRLQLALDDAGDDHVRDLRGERGGEPPVHRRRRVGQQQLADGTGSVVAMSACANSASTPLRSAFARASSTARSSRSRPETGAPAELRGRDRQRPGAAAEVGGAASAARCSSSRPRDICVVGCEPEPNPLPALDHDLEQLGRRRRVPRRADDEPARDQHRPAAEAPAPLAPVRGDVLRGELVQRGLRPPRAARGRAAARRRTRSRHALATGRSTIPPGSSGSTPSSTSSRVSAGIRNAMRCMGRRLPAGCGAAGFDGGWVAWR